MDRGSWFTRWNGRVTAWLARIAAFVLAVMAVVTFADVIARYFFNRPFTFTVEMTELAMGVIVWLAVGLTTHDNEHISVDFLTLRLAARTRAVIEILTNLTALGFLALVTWRLWVQAAFLLQKGDLTQVVRVPYWPVAYVIAIGSIFLLTGVLVQLLGALRRASGRVDAPSAPMSGL
jgi:TRAP-type C4-dicarboxylate transport system permease small subunit